MNSKAAEGGAQGDETVSADEIRDTGVGQIEFRLSVFNKPAVDGPLTKTGKLGANGKPEMDGQNCWMSSGSVRVVNFKTMADGGALIGSLSSQQAIGLGIPKNGTAAQGAVKIVAKKLLNGAANVIARTKDHFGFEAGAGFMLLDFDAKWLSAEVLAKVPDLDALWKEITATVPGLAEAGRIVRSSVSSGLSANGTKFPSSGGLHIYVAVKNATDIPRALRALHQRLMLAGLGGLVLGVVGQFLERSVVDAAVGSPERLVFEGEPVLTPPLVQDAAVRKPVTHEGPIIDTRKAIPDLTRQERIRLNTELDMQRQKLMPEAQRRRDASDKKLADHLSKKMGITIEEARRQVALRHEGMLAPELELVFDDKQIGVVTVEDVLADPERFFDETLADPLEGIAYGRNKAIVYRGNDGGIIIFSFAHGRAVYRLVHNEKTLEALINASSPASAASVLADNMDPEGIPPDARDRLIKAAANKAGIGIRAMRQVLGEAEEKRKKNRRPTAQAAFADEDKRVRMRAPAQNAPKEEIAEQIDTILSGVTPARPEDLPMRGIEGGLVTIKVQRLPDGLHSLSDDDDDVEEGGGEEKALLPAPAVPTILKVNNGEAIAMLVETHIVFLAENKKTKQMVQVALPSEHRNPLNLLKASKLPVMVGISMAPTVDVHPTKGGCVLMTAEGLHRPSGVFYSVPVEVAAAARKAKERVAAGADEALAWARKFLCDEWLVDVLTTDDGKAALIAMALTILQRHRYNTKPGFIVRGVQAAAGKTTALNLVAAAATGERMSASPWSKQEEERRKALLGIETSGAGIMCWDNIAAGTEIRCSVVESILTSGKFKDRILGTNDYRDMKTWCVLAWTGNNISPVGDMATRILMIEIASTMANPAKRKVKHGSPVEWTLRNRARVLEALYTTLLTPRPAMKEEERKTRFKKWWWEIGLAVERAFNVNNPEGDTSRMDFEAMLDASIVRDTETVGHAEFLDELYKEFGGKEFKAADVAWMLNRYASTNRPSDFDEVGPATVAAGTRGSGKAPATNYEERADAMRGSLAAALGQGALMGELTNSDIGRLLRGLVDKIVDMQGLGEARLRTRRDRTDTGKWWVEWTVRKDARAELAIIEMFGTNEERKALADAAAACNVRIPDAENWSEEQVLAVWRILKN